MFEQKKLSNFFRRFIELHVPIAYTGDSEALVPSSKNGAILTTRKHQSLGKSYVTRITQKITHGLFVCMGDLEALVPKNESQFNYACLLYWFVSHTRGTRRSLFSIVKNGAILTTRKHPSLQKYQAITITQRITHRLFLCTRDLKALVPKNESRSNHACLLYWFVSYTRRTRRPLFLIAKSGAILTKEKHPSLGKYHVTMITQRITHRLFVYTGDLKVFVPKNESRSNHAYLFYWFVSHFNRMKELYFYGQTASLLEHKARKDLKRFP